MQTGLDEGQTIPESGAAERLWLCLLLVTCMALLFDSLAVPTAKADNLYARIQGRVTDATGAAMTGVKVIATNISTSLSYSTESNGDGNFVLLNVPIGTYTVSATFTNFRTFIASNVTLLLDQVYVLNMEMQVGRVTEVVPVKANNVQVETANTQLGTVIEGTTIEDMPLITRNWLPLQTLEPGVMSSSDRFGTYSTNGAQTQQNSFLIEGQDSNDFQVNTPLIRPSLDAITEFNMVTSTINPEYGRNSGAILNATIKSGANSFHGDAFEFYRDTFLNSSDYFTGQKPIYHQNEFGGTVGGRIIKNHTFFFFSYQGQRYRQPQTSSTQTVYSAGERNGEFNQGADVDPATGKPFIAESQTIAPIALWGDSASPCPVGGTQCPPNSTTYAKLFSTGIIPTEDLNPIAVKLVDQYVPLPSGSNNAYNFNAVTSGQDNQYLFKVDQVFDAKNSIRFYGLFESNPDIQTLPYFGATLPGFPQMDKRHYQQFVGGWTHVYGHNAVNEFRFGYTRSNLAAVEPVNVVLPSSYGFNINPNIPASASLPYISVIGTQPGEVNFSIGFSQQGPQPRIDQTYQLDDNFITTSGNHTLKFGYDGRKYVITNPRGYLNNGSFSFGGIGTFSTGNAGADFLLGIPDSYTQSSGSNIDPYAYGQYLYAQDSWKARASLIVNYGLGWQINTPVTNNFNDKRAIACFRPDQQSTVYPTAPANMVFPGDRGCSPSGYYTGYKHFGPRVGFAWSPQFGNSALGDLAGQPGQFSIRGGFGLYYNQVEEELTLQNLLTPPFGLVDFGVGDIGLNPSFADPWVDIAGRGSIANKYPFTPPAAGSNVDFTSFEPMSFNVVKPQFSVPYSMNYNLTLQRELTSQTILTVGYVGAQGRHLERAYDLNEARPGACAAIPTCIDSSGNRLFQGYYFPQNFPYSAVIPGTTSLVFGGIGQESTDGDSNYNALQVSLNKQTSHSLSFLLAYTYAHSRDDGSSFENTIGGVNPISPRGTNPFYNYLNWGDSQFDARHRFVASYIYQMPIPRMLTSNAFRSTVFRGWIISGFTTLQTGFPIDIGNTAYTSGTCWAYTYYGCADNANQVAAIVKENPRSTSRHYYFNTSAFAFPTLGTFGNVGRDSFHGPGQNFTNLALLKDILVREQMKVQLRLEAQNVFNHVNFDLPVANINSSQFGQVLSDTLGPRLVQLGAKFYF